MKPHHLIDAVPATLALADPIERWPDKTFFRIDGRTVSYAGIVRRPGSSDLGPEVVIAHAERALARFQVRRYIEFVGDIPKTPTGQLETYKFRQNARNADSYDREGALA